MDLSDFLSAAEGRLDWWSKINATAQAWESAMKAGHSTEKFTNEAASVYA